ncbi:MAG: ATP-binding protein, partial [Gammaproteobacteria bacterium]|nr:ATP-binding protein [Gammaproteobacteria bacterium]
MIPPSHPNPYIGPRAFQEGELLYGREREVGELLDLLISERIVLFYSPSGAGKTSLARAALIPELKKEGFQVLPMIRVSLEPPLDTDLPSTVNRYLLSTLFSLEEELPPAQQTSLQKLANMELAAYLGQRETETAETDGTVLLFDQFEEVITVDHTDQQAKAEFFTQLGKALRYRHRWALFSMREEYRASLDPYLRPVPTRLNATFRLELLGEKAARQAMQEPANQAGVTFSETAAVKLCDDLRKVRVQKPDGTITERVGPYIEPVQLQVVCHRLWEHLSKDAREIKEADILEAGDVNTALAGYYADRVKATAKKTDVPERAIREWFEHHLITEQEIRGQVLRGPEQSQGLDNRAITPLLNAHLVRAENRRGATWYELAHDRLIKPVKKDNAEWREEHLSTLQIQGGLWERQERPHGLLLHGKALEKAERWANEHQDELASTEHDFLLACQEARTIAEQQQRQTRRIQRLAIVSTIVSIIAIIALFVAVYFYDQA